MPSAQLTFFATADDLKSMLSALETAEPLIYAKAGLFDTHVVQLYLSHSEIPSLGQCLHPSAVGNSRYLVSARDSKIHTRTVPQQKVGCQR